MRRQDFLALKFRLGRHFFSNAGSELQFVETAARARTRRSEAPGTGANVGEGRFKQDLFDGELHFGPDLLEAAANPIRARISALGVALGAGRIEDATIDDAQDFADGNFERIAHEAVAAVDAATAGDDAAATKFEKDLFQVFDGDAIAGGNFVNGDDVGMLQGEMQDRSGRVFAFCRHSHACDV